MDAFIKVSLERLARGVLVGILIGVPVGWLLGLNEDVSRAAEPILRFFNAVSGIAWLPLMILWFGFSERTISAIIVYTMAFPVIFNTMLGVSTIPNRLPNACRTLGAGSLRIIKDVYVPGSFPSVMTGFRLGIGYGWRALIAGEFVVGGGGLGFLIFNARTQGNIAEVMGGMIVLGLLWLMIDRLILSSVEQNIIGRWGLMRT
ncbi:MAG: ABC transporter permease subunit [Chloroflexota bacterium]|nr:ABC transporter permease subunit [Chloroflexota bacterium]